MTICYFGKDIENVKHFSSLKNKTKTGHEDMKATGTSVKYLSFIILKEH